MSAFRDRVRQPTAIVIASPDFGRQGKPSFRKTRRAPDRKPAWLERKEEDQRRSCRRITREFLEQTHKERAGLVEQGRAQLNHSAFRG
jgi:hypothetical protein